MKALTLWQPWASLMALVLKRNETRHWSTAYRGALAIHASTRITGWGRRGTRTEVGPFEIERDAAGLLLRGPGLAWPYRLPLGCVVATVDLRAVVSTTRLDGLTALERSLGDYTPGRYAWQTTSRSPLRPLVPVSGRQGLWDWDAPPYLEDLTTGRPR